MEMGYSKRAKFIVFVARMVVAIILFSLAACILVQQDGNMKTSLKIQKLQRNLGTVQNQNKELMIELAKYDNLENIESSATNKLKMRYPDKIQFIEKEN